MQPAYLQRRDFGTLLSRLTEAGYQCVGPTVRDGAIVYAPIAATDDLPVAISDHQAPGRYRLDRQSHGRYFAWATGPQSLRPLLFPARETLWRAERGADGAIAFLPQTPDARPTAVIGVRACDLAALALTDRHFLEGPYPDPFYAARRERLFLVAVNCSHPADTCFCVSTGDGPHADGGFDLGLTEFDAGFLVRAGSTAGENIVSRLPLTATDADHLEAERQQLQAAVEAQSRSLPGRNLRDALFSNLEHPRWDEVAARCLACGNCTSVCPTCFCHAEADVPAVDTSSSDHERVWDSCFTESHSHMRGFQVRPQIKHRYRQWLTHKLGGWHDQFGRSGCVGCGRCIAWCPVGIDITEEAASICGDSHES